MARYFYSGGRGTVDGEKSISIYWLNKNKYLNSGEGWTRYGSLRWSCNGEPTGNIRFEIHTDNDNSHMRFIYKVKKSWESEENYRDKDYKFDLVKIPCYFGGFRWYFRCGLYVKNVYCGRRVGILYSTGDYFGCRYCSNLSYDSCNQGKRLRRGMWRAFTNEDKAYKYFEKNVKRQFYRGKPTKKYRRYLRIANNFTERDLYEIEKALSKTK
ncbi:MAG: hypothetical protein WC870_03035 [Candidatus Paceibacterota bacterium]